MEELNKQENSSSIPAKKPPKTSEQIIAENEKYFKFFVHLPKILAIFFAFAFFVFAIVDAAYFGKVTYICARNSAGALFLWWAIGAVFSTIVYFASKLACAYKILHIYYLKDIREKLNEKN